MALSAGEQLKFNFKMKKKGLYIVLGIVALVLIGYFNSDEYQKNKERYSTPTQEETPETQKSKSENTSGVVTIDGNGNEVETNDEPNLNDVDWSSNFTQSEVQGEWLQVLWFNPQNSSEKTYYKDGDEEQKTLTLTTNTYQTSTETGGKNPEFNYQLKNGRMVVTTKSKMASEVFNFNVEMSKDKKLLKLSGEFEAKIYKKK